MSRHSREYKFKRPRQAVLHPCSFPVTLISLACLFVLSEATATSLDPLASSIPNPFIPWSNRHYHDNYNLVKDSSQDDNDDEPLNVVRPAFFRATDRHKVYAVDSALLRRSTSMSCTSGTELDHLESIAPCATRTLTKKRTLGRATRNSLEYWEPDHQAAAVCSEKECSKSSIISTTESRFLNSFTERKNTILSGANVPFQFPTLQLRGGSIGGGGAAAQGTRSLVFWENMICGAISRSVAQTIMHPANTMKTMLQSSRGSFSMLELMRPVNFHRLTMGAGANFVLSVPQGAVNFAVLEFVRKKLDGFVQGNSFLTRNRKALGPGLDFFSSAISTVACSVVSTPQMMITDNIMAGNYPNLPSAVRGLASQHGLQGFYAGWWPGLVGKIPSYALTWTFFQQLKRVQSQLCGRPATDIENSIMGCVASGTTVCIMIPLDTIKTRLVTQAGRAATDSKVYKGIIDCAVKVLREEGVGAFYRGLPPRLISVVPMIGIQFGVYEFMRKVMLQRRMSKEVPSKKDKRKLKFGPIVEDDEYDKADVLQQAAMEVAASPAHPYPVPHFHKLLLNGAVGKTTKVRSR